MKNSFGLPKCFVYQVQYEYYNDNFYHCVEQATDTTFVLYNYLKGVISIMFSTV